MRACLYKTTNTVNGKFYIGVHLRDPNIDKYLGQGQAISKAIRKYGADKFVCEILEEFDSIDEAYAREKEIVDSQFIKNKQNYNVIPGGRGNSNLGKIAIEMKAGLHGMTTEQRRVIAKRNRMNQSVEERARIAKMGQDAMKANRLKKKTEFYLNFQGPSIPSSIMKERKKILKAENTRDTYEKMGVQRGNKNFAAFASNTKGTKMYNNGVRNFVYRGDHAEFDSFLKENGYNKGRRFVARKQAISASQQGQTVIG